VSAAADLARSAVDEWGALVSAAIVGTDRRVPPPAEPGWQPWATASDPAVALLDRAAAVVVARRAGACPPPPPPAPPAAPVDTRPPCPSACSVRLTRILAGEHDVLLAEWLERCEALDVQLPWAALPVLLLRGRRVPELDSVVRRMSRGRAAWLAEVLPELGVRPTGATTRAPQAPAAAAAGHVWGRPPAPPDSAAAVSGIVQVFVDHLASWAAAPQLRLVVAAVDPAWLPALVAELSRLSFHAPTERTRADVLSLAEFRLAMVHEFDSAARSAARTAAPAAPDPSAAREGDP
jgi:hypothetical protein